VTHPSSTTVALLAVALATSACGGSDQGGMNASNAAGVQEMGPMGGGTGTGAGTQDQGTAASVGEVDNGNVTPGNIDPNNAREGIPTGGNHQ
jgi:hypothetical protein